MGSAGRYQNIQSQYSNVTISRYNNVVSGINYQLVSMAIKTCDYCQKQSSNYRKYCMSLLAVQTEVPQFQNPYLSMGKNGPFCCAVMPEI